MAKKPNTAQSQLSSKVVASLREGALFVFAAVALVITVALFTYSEQDPGFTHAVSGGEVQNEMGTAGA